MKVNNVTIDSSAFGYQKLVIEASYDEKRDKHFLEAMAKGQALNLYVVEKTKWHDHFVKLSKEELAAYQVDYCEPYKETWDKEQAQITTNPCSEILLKDYAGVRDYIMPSGCNEINKPTQFRQEYEAKFMEDNPKAIDAPMPHSLRGENNNTQGFYNKTNLVRVSGTNGLSGNALVEDDKVTITFSLPGIEADRLKIVRVNNTLRISVLKNNQEEYDPATQTIKYANYYLADYESVESVKLDLGILTIIIDRDADVEEFKL